jgi:hypothetical protein
MFLFKGLCDTRNYKLVLDSRLQFDLHSSKSTFVQMEDAMQTTVKIEPELLTRLKIHAAMTAQTQQDILHAALVEYLDRHETNGMTTTKGKSQ